MDHPNFRDHQRSLVCASVLGELYCVAAIPSPIVFNDVHHILDFDHDIPQALRQASENQGLLFVPHGNISQTILEDEELEEDEEEEQKEEEDTKPQVVSVSSLPRYDPGVPSDIEPPTAVFQVKLVCTILEISSSQIVTVKNKAKLRFALASLHMYLFTKKSLPSDGKVLSYSMTFVLSTALPCTSLTLSFYVTALNNINAINTTTKECLYQLNSPFLICLICYTPG